MSAVAAICSDCGCDSIDPDGKCWVCPDPSLRSNLWDDWGDFEQPECICGAPVSRWADCCSKECDERDRKLLASMGTCGGCGRYGEYGKPCFRPLDGVMEECGQFV